MVKLYSLLKANDVEIKLGEVEGETTTTAEAKYNDIVQRFYHRLLAPQVLFLQKNALTHIFI